MQRSFLTVRIALLVLLLLALAGSISTGAYELTGKELWTGLTGGAGEMEHFLIWSVRVPRVLLAVLIGAALAVGGAATQGLFRNPLAEPTLIGVTSGAMLFAVVVLGLQATLLPALPTWLQPFAVGVAAFCGALFTTAIVYRMATEGGRMNVTTMLLAGIAIASLAGAVVGLLVYGADDNELRDISFWTLGSLAGAGWPQVVIATVVVLPGTYFLHRNALALNAFLLGEREAEQLGFHVGRVKRRIIVWVALITGVSVSLTGLIGFVGLVIPHLLRLWQGTDYRRLLLHSAVLGAAFLLAADTLARRVVAPAELPIGILTALVGAPFFIWLLLRARRQMATL